MNPAGEFQQLPAIASTLCDRLRSLRAAKSWTLEEAGKRIGVPRQYLSHLECGRVRDPGLKLSLKIANAYDVSLDYIAGREPAETGTSDPVLARVLFQIKAQPKSVVEALEEILSRMST